MTPTVAAGQKSGLIQAETASADLYNLLAIFLQPPTESLFVGLGNGTIRDDTKDIFDELGWCCSSTKTVLKLLSDFHDGILDDTYSFSHLRSEYTCLFSHPKKPKIALYEGAFLEAQKKDTTHTQQREKAMLQGQRELDFIETETMLFINKAALDAERCYKKRGLKRSKNLNIPADCMSTEMEFMSLLHLQKAAAFQDNNNQLLQELEDSLVEFRRIHLKKWMHAFYKSLNEESSSAVYRAVGLMGTLLAYAELNK